MTRHRTIDTISVLRLVLLRAFDELADALLDLYEREFPGERWNEAVVCCEKIPWASPQVRAQLQQRPKDLSTLVLPLFAFPERWQNLHGLAFQLREFRNDFVHRRLAVGGGGERWATPARIGEAMAAGRNFVAAIGADGRAFHEAASFAELVAPSNGLVAADVLERIFVRSPPPRDNERVPIPQDRKGFLFSEEQRGAVDAIEAWFRHSDRGRSTRNRFSLSGPAGSGKTSIIGEALRMLDLPPEAVWVLSPTSKAREVLRLRLPERFRGSCRTLAGALWRHIPGTPDGQDPTFTRTPRPVNRQIRLVIVDEASMLKRSELELLDSYVTVLVGDPDQLPPVMGANEGDEDDAGALTSPTLALTQIWRQTDGHPIRRAADLARRGEPLGLFGTDGVRVLDESDGALTSNRLDELMLEHDVVLTARNRTRIRANMRIRALLGHARFPGDVAPKPGDWLIADANFTRRDGVTIENGTRLRVTGVHGTVNVRNNRPEIEEFDVDLRVESASPFDARVLVSGQMLAGKHLCGSREVTRDISGSLCDPQVLRAEWGHAVTVHKAQGSEWPRVLVLDDPLAEQRVAPRRWNYTAYTRAYHHLTIVRLRPGSHLL